MKRDAEGRGSASLSSAVLDTARAIYREVLFMHRIATPRGLVLGWLCVLAFLVLAVAYGRYELLAYHDRAAAARWTAAPGCRGTSAPRSPCQYEAAQIKAAQYRYGNSPHLTILRADGVREDVTVNTGGIPTRPDIQALVPGARIRVQTFQDRTTVVIMPHGALPTYALPGSRWTHDIGTAQFCFRALLLWWLAALFGVTRLYHLTLLNPKLAKNP